jgi:hypothetical protein
MRSSLRFFPACPTGIVVDDAALPRYMDITFANTNTFSRSLVVSLNRCAVNLEM